MRCTSLKFINTERDTSEQQHFFNFIQADVYAHIRVCVCQYMYSIQLKCFLMQEEIAFLIEIWEYSISVWSGGVMKNGNKVS